MSDQSWSDGSGWTTATQITTEMQSAGLMRPGRRVLATCPDWHLSRFRVSVFSIQGELKHSECRYDGDFNLPNQCC